MIDLHLHTTASDGKHTPAELLKKCEELGLELIAISDHYSVAGYDDLKDPAVRSLFSGEIIPACEFSAHFKGIGIEVLGYGIDPDVAKSFIAAHYVPMDKKQENDLELMIQVYKERGFPFDEEQARKNLLTERIGRDAIWKELNKYPENVARYLDPASATDYKSFHRKEVTNSASPYFVSADRYAPSAAEVCRYIQSLGGKAIIAHPGCYNQTIYDAAEELVLDAKPDGLEAWYSIHTPAQREYFLKICKKYGLIFSGGSDYHSEERAAAYGNVLGMPELADIFPVAEIRQWADQLKKI